MNKIIVINITIAAFCLATVKAQEVVTGLQSNLQIKSEWKKSDKKKK